MVMEGILLKRGKKDALWKERLFRIENGILGYTKLDSTNHNQLGCVELQQVSITVLPIGAEGRPGYLFGVTPINEPMYLLEACMEVERTQWLTAFRTAGAQIDEQESTTSYVIEGVLLKRGKQTAMKERYFGIEASRMDYMKEKDSKRLGSFELQGAKLVLFPPNHDHCPGFLFGITPLHGDRLYCLGASSALERARWLQIIRRAGAIEPDIDPIARLSENKSGLVLRPAQPKPSVLTIDTEDEYPLETNSLDSVSSLGSPSSLLKNVLPAEYVMEGFLLKKGDAAWKERYFAIEATQELCYMKEKGGSKLGVISLSGAMVYLFPPGSEDRPGFSFGIERAPGDRTYVLECPSLADRGQWVTALKLAGAIVELPPIALVEGVLWKRGDKIKSWKQRYCTFENGKLHYMKHKYGKQLGAIEIANAKIIALPPSAEGGPAGFPFSIKPLNVERTYVLGAGTASDRQKWLSALIPPPPSPQASLPSPVRAISFRPPPPPPSPSHLRPPPPPPPNVRPPPSAEFPRPASPHQPRPPTPKSPRAEILFPPLPRCLPTVVEELSSTTARPPPKPKPPLTSV